MAAEGAVIGFALLVNFQIVSEFIFITFLDNIQFFIHRFRFCFQKHIPKKSEIFFFKGSDILILSTIYKKS